MKDQLGSKGTLNDIVGNFNDFNEKLSSGLLLNNNIISNYETLVNINAK